MKEPAVLSRQRDTNKQQQPARCLSQNERQHTAAQIGEQESSLASIREMGGLSCRDDSSGGSGDRIEDQSTREQTDR